MLASLGSSAILPITDSPSTSLNPKLRKALLDALSTEKEIDDETTTISSLTDDGDLAETTDPSSIKIHTFTVNGDKSDENEIIKTIIITRPKTTLTPPRLSDRQDNVKINFRSENDQNSVDASSSKKAEVSVTKPITPQTTPSPPVTNDDG